MREGAEGEQGGRRGPADVSSAAPSRRGGVSGCPRECLWIPGLQLRSGSMLERVAWHQRPRSWKWDREAGTRKVPAEKH